MATAVIGQFLNTYPWPQLSSVSFETPIHDHICHRSVSRLLSMAIAVIGQFINTYPWPLLSSVSFQTHLCSQLFPAGFQTPIYCHGCNRLVSRHLSIAITDKLPETYPWPQLLPASFQTRIHGYRYHRSVSRHLSMAIAVTVQFPDTYTWP